MPSEALQLERLVDHPKIRRAATKTSRLFAYLPPATTSRRSLGFLRRYGTGAPGSRSIASNSSAFAAMPRAPSPASQSSYGPRREGEISRSPAKAVLANRPPRSGGHPPAARCQGQQADFGLIAARSHNALLPRAAYSRGILGSRPSNR